MKFEWDSKKAAANRKKHKVSFDEAISVFADPLASIFDDEDHSDDAERREIIVGHSILNRIVLVCFTERGKDLVRIFTARLATKRECEDYEENTTS